MTWDLLRKYLGAHAVRLVLVAVLSTLGGLAQAFSLILVAACAVAIASGSPDASVPLAVTDVDVPVLVTLAFAVLAAIAMTALQVTSAWIASGLVARVQTEARRSLLEAYLGASWEALSSERRGHLQQLLTAHVAKTTQGVVYVNYLVTAGCSLLVLAVSAVLLSPVMALALGVLLVVLTIPLNPMKRGTRNAAERHSVADREFAVSMADIVSHSRETDLFDVTDPLTEHYQRLDHLVAVSNRRIHFFQLALPTSYVGVGLVGFVGALALVKIFAVGDLSAISAMVMLLLRSIAYGQIVQTAQQGLGEVGPYILQMEEHRAEYSGRVRRFGSTPLTGVKRLELRGVSYSYPGDSPALHDLDLRIEQGEKIGIAGPSGGGKTTLAQILVRLREPTSGAYEVNGIAASSYDRQTWARGVAMVPQNPVFLDGSIADNIRFFRSWLTEEDVRDAARAAHIEDEILAMPEGFETQLRGLSVGLSGGQQQRLTIARALAGRPGLLVLDEPTSALDTRSERLIRESINELPGGTTVIVVAHRASTLQVSDRILVLENGRITGFDRPDALERHQAFLGS